MYPSEIVEFTLTHPSHPTNTLHITYMYRKMRVQAVIGNSLLKGLNYFLLCNESNEKNYNFCYKLPTEKVTRYRY